MTGMTFNGVRAFSDRDIDECYRQTTELNNNYEGNLSHEELLAFEEECLERLWEVGVQNAHDEWWDASAPENWEIYEPSQQYEPLPVAA